MPKPKPRQPSAAELAARARVLKPREGAQEAFDIGEDYVRETVVVTELPDPPGTEVVEASVSRSTNRRAATDKVNVEEAVMHILREEAAEIAARIGRFGVVFPPAFQQDMVDHVYSMLALAAQGHQVGGGVLARR